MKMKFNEHFGNIIKRYREGLKVANAKCLVVESGKGKYGEYKVCWCQTFGGLLPMKINANLEDAPKEGEDCTVYLRPDFRGYAKVFVRKEKNEDENA